VNPAQPLVSVVVPAYNEARRLPRTLSAWSEFFVGQPYSAEVVLVDDGSQDETAQCAEAHAGVRLIRLPRNRGKGAAVRAGMLGASGRFIFYVDADLNVAPRHLTTALGLFEARLCDVVVGSRRLSAYAAQERSIPRLLAGGLVQVSRRGLVLPVIRDTQCGFKGFRREIGLAIFERARIDSFAFDIEALFLARKLGCAIVEMPVETTFQAESTFDVSKHLRPFLADIVAIRRNDLGGLYG
jgi:glycosyltransferase involved in cell wall biosynthesis